MLNSCLCNNACGFLPHRCLFVIMQSSSMSQRSCTDNSSHCVASASEAQMFSSSWLKESMACPADVAAHYMLANTCFYSCFASSSISLHPQRYSIEKSISIKLVGSQPLTVKLSGSHMVVARDEEETCTWRNHWLLLKPFDKRKDTENEMMTYIREDSDWILGIVPYFK